MIESMAYWVKDVDIERFGDKDDNRVIFIGNLSKNDQEFDLREFEEKGTYTDVFTREIALLKSGTTLKLIGFEFRIFVNQTNI